MTKSWFEMTSFLPIFLSCISREPEHGLCEVGQNLSTLRYQFKCFWGCHRCKWTKIDQIMLMRSMLKTFEQQRSWFDSQFDHTQALWSTFKCKHNNKEQTDLTCSNSSFGSPFHWKLIITSSCFSKQDEWRVKSSPDLHCSLRLHSFLQYHSVQFPFGPASSLIFVPVFHKDLQSSFP